MKGRNKKELIPMFRDVTIVTENGEEFTLKNLQIKCPICGSWKVSANGTRKRKDGRVEAFICRNSKCENGDHKTPKQFILTTSYEFKRLVFVTLERLYEDLLVDGAKSKTIAKKYNISSSQVSKLRAVFIEALEKVEGLDKLVDVPQSERTICMDETFLKIEATSIYIIIATGYKTHKILGIKVSKTRKEEDMRQVFDEVEQNTKKSISHVISDGWGSTQKMTRELGREITHIIHKHKKPHKKVVIRHYYYSQTHRINLELGIKNDLFKKRSKRRFHYTFSKTPLTPLSTKKRGRPKGSKNKKKTKKKTVKKKKRGPRGLFKVFNKGKRGYVKVDPYRETLKFGNDMDMRIIATLTGVSKLFYRKTVQNNIGECSNSILKSILKLCGPKTITSAEKKIRSYVIIKNNPALLSKIKIERNIRGDFIKDKLIPPELAQLLSWGCTLAIN